MANTAILNLRTNKDINFEPLQTTVAATEEESVLLAEQLTQVAIPLEVLLQALTIATYDKEAAFRYAHYYLNKSKKPKWVVIKNSSNSETKWNVTRKARTAYCNLKK